ncbi:hypothetical protein NDU88_000353 [Pleurodeles waltl]|uniref:Uncharacterized protein n=1 Tax=Pleurodeles waltl TaxID=8319 RepID=A0AAV7V6Q9_PLEWA|nr:hypothetical protein NDU88_000353 [Pleurodeles waltl]
MLAHSHGTQRDTRAGKRFCLQTAPVGAMGRHTEAQHPQPDSTGSFFYVYGAVRSSPLSLSALFESGARIGWAS